MGRGEVFEHKGLIEKRQLRPKKGYLMSQVTQPTLEKGADPKYFSPKNYFILLPFP